MKHRWRQVDYREIVDDPARPKWPRNAIFIPAPGKELPPKRIVAAIVVEWCSRCGRLRRQWLRGSDGSVFQTKITRPSGVKSGDGCRSRSRAAP